MSFSEPDIGRDGGELYRLAFASRRAADGEALAETLLGIVETSRRNNETSGVTGALAVCGESFVQVLEGPRDAVAATFERISRDARHDAIRIAEARPIVERGFGDDPMAFAGEAEWARDLLERTAEHLGSDASEPEAPAVVAQPPAAAQPAGADHRRPAQPALPSGWSRIVAQASAPVACFTIDGALLDASADYRDMLGLPRSGAAGLRHADLVTAEESESAPYAALWSSLADAVPSATELRMRRSDGEELSVRASYSLTFDDADGGPVVVEHALDQTMAKRREADSQSQVAAIRKSHAVISFDMRGVILDANELFLEAFGYGLDEIVGRHHRMFVEPAYAHGAEYAAFWSALSRGRHAAGLYRRLGRDGREVWLQATYNPVVDHLGRLSKVLKFATVVTEEKLRQAEHQGQIAAIHKAQCVISFDLDGVVLDANDNFLDLMGYRLSDLQGRHHRMFVTPEQAASADYAAFWSRLASGRHEAGEFKRVGRDGREVWLRATYNPIYDMNGRPFRVVTYAIDVTSEKLSRADYEGQLAAIDKAQGVLVLSLDGAILEANDNLLEITGYGRDELVGKSHSQLVENGQAEAADYVAFWETLRSGKHMAGIFKRRHKSGRELWLQATYTPILDLNGEPYKVVKFASDVSSEVALAEAYEDAKRQANHDAATALPNRLRLASFMESALSRHGARLAVLYLDLDRFKQINDEHGHPAGDRVLAETADRLRRELGDDQLVARVGGDEFVIVAPNLADEAIEALCSRLMAAATAPVRFEGLSLEVGLSIGVAVAPDDGLNPDDLLRAADVALYRSKQNGRGMFSFFAKSLNDRFAAYHTAIEDMRRGLDAGDFFVEFQPRFCAKTRRIRSVETLARWRHPQRGLVPPGEFISIAERSGLIAPLGEFVLRAACRVAAGLDDVNVSVNVSPVQFRDTDLVAVVTTALFESGLDPRRLELEITEGVLLEDAERARAALDRLTTIGVKFEMDDFGTGYSSLSSLRSYPFHSIKIDRQFVGDLEGRAGGREVVRAILGLGKALGLLVTAEGVETERQLEMLADDGCDEVQGFLLARPMSTERLIDMLAGRVGPETARETGGQELRLVAVNGEPGPGPRPGGPPRRAAG